MDFTDDQKATIAQRLQEGASMADIQRLINDEFKGNLTYMETRFLIDDLELEIPQKSEPEPTVDDSEASGEALPAEATLEDDEAVTVEVDRIKRPGAAMSGSVKFSDGQKATWYVDTYGRLGLEPEQEGYQPDPEDIQAFQTELQSALQGPAGA